MPYDVLMRPVHAVRVFALIGLAAFAGTAPATAVAGDGPPADTERDRTLTDLIAALDSPKAADRDDALDRLVNRGRTGRAACRRAMAGASPQQRLGIERVLLHIPFTHPDAPPAVNQAFENYPTLSAEQRRAQLVGHMAHLGQQSMGAWLRVLHRDPSASVRWEAARHICDYVMNDESVTRSLVADTAAVGGEIPPVFDYDGDDVVPVDQNWPLLAAAGFAQLTTHADRAITLMQLAIDAENKSPSALDGQADFAYASLIERAVDHRQFATAVSLYRQQALVSAVWVPRDPESQVDLPSDYLPSPAVSGLIATQCAFGPFPGFADDLRTCQGCLASPQVLYCLAILADRRHHPVVAAATRRVAMVTGGWSLPDHFMTACFLLDQHWDDDAEREFKICLTLSPAERFTIYYDLRRVAIDRDDDLSAGKYLEAALADPAAAQFGTIDGATTWNPDLALAQVQCHYIRAARNVGDNDTAKKRVQKWLEIDMQKHVLPEEPSMAADVVPVLDAMGRKEDADRLFEIAYELLHAKVTRSPDDPMPKNNLAWLLVECNRHPEEAMRMAGAAAAADPFDSDVLDTQAEVLFQAGRKNEAAEVETRAAGYKPQSRMIAQKAARYRKAAGL
jgi:tetratricopeptide (TPR) repeat protein